MLDEIGILMETDVVILMSTYNGEEFLREQIDSIFAQSWQGKIVIFIRDDGSKDSTLEMIKSIDNTPTRKIELIEGENCGPQKSFLNLIKSAPEALYYFFADQDDVWDADKIETAVNSMRSAGDVPVVYCSNYRLSDTELKVYKEKAIENSPKFTPLKILFYNQIPGCTMAFNFRLMCLLKKIEIDNVMMHDSMVLSFAAFCGLIIYDENSKIIHRIHSQNVVGDGHKKIHLFTWLKNKFSLLIHKENYDVSKMAEQFLIATQGENNLNYIEDILLLRDFKKKLYYTRKLLRHKDTKDKPFDRTTLSIRSKIFFHLF